MNIDVRPPPSSAHPGASVCYLCGNAGGCPRCDARGGTYEDVSQGCPSVNAPWYECPDCLGSGLCPGCDRERTSP